MPTINTPIICIARTNKFQYSETFIDNQIQQIPHQFLLFGGWQPYIQSPNSSIFKGIMGINPIRGFVKKYFKSYYQKKYTQHLTNFLIENKIEVFLANYGITGTKVLEACKNSNTKLVVHFHGFDASHTKTIEKYKLDYIRLFDYSKKIISVSKIMTQNLITIGASEDKIICIPYGVDTTIFNGSDPWSADESLYFVGRFTAKKAPDKLLLAFNKVLSTHPNAKLNLIGDGELLDECIQIVKSLNIENNVIFHGKRDPNYIVSELKKAKIFVQHSVIAPNGDSEGTPNTILEASSMGLPIVSTKHAGINEAVINGETGFLVEENDWSEMANKIILLLSDKELCRTFGNAARQHILKNYELIAQTKKLETVLKTI